MNPIKLQITLTQNQNSISTATVLDTALLPQNCLLIVNEQTTVIVSKNSAGQLELIEPWQHETTTNANAYIAPLSIDLISSVQTIQNIKSYIQAFESKRNELMTTDEPSITVVDSLGNSYEFQSYKALKELSNQQTESIKPTLIHDNEDGTISIQADNGIVDIDLNSQSNNAFDFNPEKTDNDSVKIHVQQTSPMCNSNKIGDLFIDQVAGEIRVSVAKGQYTQLSNTLNSRYFMYVRRAIIRLKVAYTGIITMRVYPTSSGNTGLPAGCPALIDGQWNEVSFSVTNLINITSNNIGTEFFEGFIDFVHLEDDFKYCQFDRKTTYFPEIDADLINNFGNTIEQLNQIFIVFNLRTDGFWISENVAPKTYVFREGTSITNSSDYEFTALNSDGLDVVKFFGNLQNVSSEAIFTVTEISSGGFSFTETNRSQDRLYSDNSIKVEAKLSQLAIKRVLDAEPVSGAVLINSIKMKLEQ